MAGHWDHKKKLKNNNNNEQQQLKIIDTVKETADQYTLSKFGFKRGFYIFDVNVNGRSCCVLADMHKIMADIKIPNIFS